MEYGENIVTPRNRKRVANSEHKPYPKLQRPDSTHPEIADSSWVMECPWRDPGDFGRSGIGEVSRRIGDAATESTPVRCRCLLPLRTSRRTELRGWIEQ